MLSPHFHLHFLPRCPGNQGRFVVGCNSPWVLLQYLVLQWEACLLGLPVNEPHSLTGNAPALALVLDVAQDQDVGAGGVGDVGAVGRSPGGIIHGAPAGSRAGCCGNHHCAHGRTAYRSGSVVRSERGR